MSDEPRDRQKPEMPAVRTTIVGGRPPGSGVPLGSVPRGVEILIQKAAVDPDFKALLLEKRSAAAAEIELPLQPAEAAMLDNAPTEQLEAIITGTKVPEKTRRALLGTVTAATLAVLGVSIIVPSLARSRGIEPDVPPTTPGVRPNQIPTTRGIQPDVPPTIGTDTQPDSEPPEPEDKTPKPNLAPTGIRPDRPSEAK